LSNIPDNTDAERPADKIRMDTGVDLAYVDSRHAALVSGSHLAGRQAELECLSTRFHATDSARDARTQGTRLRFLPAMLCRAYQRSEIHRRVVMACCSYAQMLDRRSRLPGGQRRSQWSVSICPCFPRLLGRHYVADVADDAASALTTQCTGGSAGCDACFQVFEEYYRLDLEPAVLTISGRGLTALLSKGLLRTPARTV